MNKTVLHLFARIQRKEIRKGVTSVLMVVWGAWVRKIFNAGSAPGKGKVGRSVSPFLSWKTGLGLGFGKKVNWDWHCSTRKFWELPYKKLWKWKYTIENKSFIKSFSYQPTVKSSLNELQAVMAFIPSMQCVVLKYWCRCYHFVC